jgi:hypothetical protein
VRKILLQYDYGAEEGALAIGGFCGREVFDAADRYE